MCGRTPLVISLATADIIYACRVDVQMSKHAKLEKKAIDDVLGGEEEWKNVAKTDGESVLAACGSPEGQLSGWYLHQESFAYRSTWEWWGGWCTGLAPSLQCHTKFPWCEYRGKRAVSKSVLFFACHGCVCLQLPAPAVQQARLTSWRFRPALLMNQQRSSTSAWTAATDGRRARCRHNTA